MLRRLKCRYHPSISCNWEIMTIQSSNTSECVYDWTLKRKKNKQLLQPRASHWHCRRSMWHLCLDTLLTRQHSTSLMQSDARRLCDTSKWCRPRGPSLVSLFQNCHRSHEFKASDLRPSRWQRSAETTELFMSNSWTPGYGAWVLNSNQYDACVGHMIWSVQMLTVCHTMAQGRPVWHFQLKNDGQRLEDEGGEEGLS